MKKDILTALKILTLGFFLLIITTSCTSLGLDSQTKKSRALQKSVDEITDGGFKVPLPEDYPLIIAYVSYPPLETGINIINLFYSPEKIKLEDIYKDEEMKSIAEQQSHKKYLYGPYKGDQLIWIQYLPSPANPSTSAGADEIRSWTINDQEILYDYVSRRGEEAILVQLVLDKGILAAFYRLDERFTEEDAEAFTTYLMVFYQIETQY